MLEVQAGSTATVEWIDGGRVARRMATRGPVVIGRGSAADLSLDPEDLGISRRAAVLEPLGPCWRLTNGSTNRPLLVREPTGVGTVLPAGGTRSVPDGGVTIVVEGLLRRHGIRVLPEIPAGPSTDLPHGNQEVDLVTLDVPLPTAAEREALVALAAGYLADFPRWDPRPLTYTEAGERLGMRASTVRKRVEWYRRRLVRAGFAGGELADARAAIVEVALAGGVLQRPS